MKKLFIPILFSIIYGNCLAQLSIKGTVTDKESHEQIVAAGILCTELNKAARTDEKG